MQAYSDYKMRLMPCFNVLAIYLPEDRNLNNIDEYYILSFFHLVAHTCIRYHFGVDVRIYLVMRLRKHFSSDLSFYLLEVDSSGKTCL